MPSRLHLPRPRGRLLLLLLALLLGALFLAGAWHTWDYVENDPTFCTSCHTMETAYTRWRQSPHSSLNCHRCHLPDAISNLKQIWSYLSMDLEGPTHRAEVPDRVCRQCHFSDDSRWKQVAQTRGHRVHVKQHRIPCVTCHATALHRFVPPKGICARCHEEITIDMPDMEDLHCLQCHRFLADDARSLKPTRADCLQCHEDIQHGDETFPKDAPMRWPCGRCHQPHTKPMPTRATCLGCHADDLEGGALHTQPAHARCADCHRPHRWKVKGRDLCLACHKDKSRHQPEKACGDCHDL